MGGNDNTPVFRNPGAQGIDADIRGAGQKIFQFALDIILCIHIHLVSGFFRVIGEGHNERIDVIPKGQGRIQSGEETDYVNFFQGGTFQTEKGNDAQPPAMEGKGRAITAGVVIG
jgi:hypothetical protein